MGQQEKKLNKYGKFIKIPYSWTRLCKKYLIKNRKGEDQNITINLNEIYLLARIAGWNDSGKECIETNASFAESLNVSIDTIKKYIRELRLVGLIKTYEEKDTPTHTSKRILYVQYQMIDELLGMNVPSKDESDNELGTNVTEWGDECTQYESTNIPSKGDECKPNKTNKTNNIKYNTNGADAPNEANASESSKEEHNLIKIFRKENIDKIQVYGYEKVFIGNSKFNEILKNLMYTLDENTMLERYISAAKEQGIGRDYTCSYIQEYIYDITEGKS